MTTQKKLRMTPEQRALTPIRIPMPLRYLINLTLILCLWLIFRALITGGVITNYWTGILITVGINIILAVSLNVATGYLGQLPLGHAGFMAVGAYAGGAAWWRPATMRHWCSHPTVPAACSGATATWWTTRPCCWPFTTGSPAALGARWNMPCAGGCKLWIFPQ